jgi:endonuclease/exonuclease/phosphatase family metal-dependent hydrolase
MKKLHSVLIKILILITIILVSPNCKGEVSEGSYLSPLVDFTISVKNPKVGEEVLIKADALSGSSKIVSWNWNVGTVATFNAKQFNYSWEYPGVYEVSLTVKDEWNNVSKIKKSITVAEQSTPPFNDSDGEYITLRILTYNIFHGETTAGTIDMDLFGNIIKEQNPDLVALQEVDKKTTRVGGIDITAELSKRTGLTGYFCKHRDYQGGEYGNAILSKYPVTNIDLIEGYRNTATGVTIPFAKIEVQKGIYIYFNTSHLSTDLIVREVHVRQLLDYYIKTLNRSPLLICGDLNAEPDAPEIKTLLTEFSLSDTTLANTFSTRTGMRKKIDYVLYPSNSDWQVVETKIIYRPEASDHCALLSVLKYKKPKK